MQPSKTQDVLSSDNSKYIVMKKVCLKKTTTNPINFASGFMLLAFLANFGYSCSNDDDRPLVPNEITQEIKDLIYFKGEEDAPTVLIYTQDGPNNQLSEQEVDLFFELFDTTDILMANVHQAQTLDSTVVKGSDISLDQAVRINSESIEKLDEVISYFKDQGRTVYVLGISFGAFITQELIAIKGLDTADKYLIMTGRLDMPDVLIQGAAEGKEGFFENGLTPIVDENPHPDVKERNLIRLTAGLGRNKYTQLLNPIEDLSNVTYIYGETDMAVGRLTPDEVQFLASRNTNIIMGSGGHTATFDDYIVQGLKEAFGIEVLMP